MSATQIIYILQSTPYILEQKTWKKYSVCCVPPPMKSSLSRYKYELSKYYGWMFGVSRDSPVPRGS